LLEEWAVEVLELAGWLAGELADPEPALELAAVPSLPAAALLALEVLTA
jgi:hypothetical protein